MLRHAPLARVFALVAALGLVGVACGGGGVTCADGWPSPSTGSGACARHGGVAAPVSLSSYLRWMLAGGVATALAYWWIRQRLRRWRQHHDTPPDTASERAELRKLIQSVVKSDADLDAFCLDHFKDVHDQFTLGMERTQKVTLLMRSVDPEQIRERLRQTWPEATAAHEARDRARDPTPISHP